MTRTFWCGPFTVMRSPQSKNGGKRTWMIIDRNGTPVKTGIHYQQDAKTIRDNMNRQRPFTEEPTE
jgi:hypothetical protein